MWTRPGYKPDRRLAVWAPGSDGQVWPVRGRTATLKMREVGPLAEALAVVASGSGASGSASESSGRPAESVSRQPAQSPRDEPKFVDKGRPVRPPWDAGKLAPAERPGDAEDFDECS